MTGIHYVLDGDGLCDGSGIFDAIRRKVKPEVLQACRVILHALLDEPEEPKRKKATKKKVGVGKKQRPAERRTAKNRCASRYIRSGKARARCALKRGHLIPHQTGEAPYPKFIWPNSPRAKPARPKPKPKSPLRKSKSK